MSWGAWVRGWRASRVSLAVKGPLPVSASEAAPARVNADLPRPSTPPAVPVTLPTLRRRTCGAIDRLSGAVCTQPLDHPAVRIVTRTLHGDHPQVTYQFAGDHVDMSDPSSPISWPDDEWTQHRPVCERWGSMAHHRAPSDRDRGIHDPARGLWTCGPCHEHIHRHPEVAYAKGWLIKDGAT